MRSLLGSPIHPVTSNGSEAAEPSAPPRRENLPRPAACCLCPGNCIAPPSTSPTAATHASPNSRQTSRTLNYGVVNAQDIRSCTTTEAQLLLLIVYQRLNNGARRPSRLANYSSLQVSSPSPSTELGLACPSHAEFARCGARVATANARVQ